MDSDATMLFVIEYDHHSTHLPNELDNPGGLKADEVSVPIGR